MSAPRQTHSPDLCVTSRGTTTFSDYQVTVDIADAERMAIGIADGNGIAEFFQVDEVDLAQPPLVQAFEMFPSAKKVTHCLSGRANSS